MALPKYIKLGLWKTKQKLIVVATRLIFSAANYNKTMFPGITLT